MPCQGVLNLTAQDIARMLARNESVEIQTFAKDTLMQEFEKHKLDVKYNFTGLNLAPTADGWRVTAVKEISHDQKRK